jgi:uncharacterized protein (DUF1778 family)
VEESAVTRARSVIAEYQPVVLSPGEFSRFIEALDEAPVTVPRRRPRWLDGSWDRS